ncbi:hypothetical protein [Burkholderia plantarii]|uniref:Fe2OG dioxygenase domain-containing protein n=1 Tax=Burkholderia plantarii TaxID=41899 RepID=A0A0B6RUX5_BURPL|nr:hypothetical protein [Burkholderia plantarii]AJK49162.1 hypothetical protein BGL_2c10840 [Burkholderia plantarii]ALK33411.1 hypothetical protein bpln_2g11700 [Burkholderia plantarii]WLE62466.1 hypothetical protein GIY62_34390 [Burkholderia plantarii]GLZ16574.1 hypothetical protein Bpla01_01040 [Burkholderia plantarii]
MNGMPCPAPVRLPHEPIHLDDVLDAAARADWIGHVMRMRAHWRQRHPLVPFFTLGLAAYLDCSAGGTDLYRDADVRHASNALLAGTFRPLLDTVADALAGCLGAPAVLADDAALPGFHIYLPHPAFGGPVAQIHRDLQFRDVYPAFEPEPGKLVSFTLSLSTPPGSGLNQWAGDAERPEFFAYRDGALVVHDGLVTHQAVLACNGAIERITLQGHGVRRDDGAFVLYW